MVAQEDNVAYLDGVVDVDAMRARYLALRPFLDERQRRLFAAAEARAAGWGGVSAASRATGIARSTIDRALDDLDAGLAADDRVRRVGGGRKELTTIDRELIADLERIVAPTTRGDPEQPLRWTRSRACGKSPRP